MNGQRRYKYLVVGRDRSYFVKIKHSDSTKKFSETDNIKMFVFLIDNICVLFSGRVFTTNSRHTYGHKLCSLPLRLVPLFVSGRLHSGAYQVKRKGLSPIP